MYVSTYLCNLLISCILNCEGCICISCNRDPMVRGLPKFSYIELVKGMTLILGELRMLVMNDFVLIFWAFWL